MEDDKERAKKSSNAIIIAPSILSADFGVLKADCESALRNGGDWLHVDVMDGHFVPNISIGVPVVESLRRCFPSAFLDCHLMVSEPHKWVTPFARAGATQFTFHIEVCPDPASLIAAIRAAGMKVGVSLKPGTSVDAIAACAAAVDVILVMSVEPGFGGQSFIHAVVPKVAALRAMAPPTVRISMDGGIVADTAGECGAVGADTYVCGSAFFKLKDPERATLAQAIRAAAA